MIGQLLQKPTCRKAATIGINPILAAAIGLTPDGLTNLDFITQNLAIMSIRSFWLIFLKVIGIFFLYSSLSVIPSLAAIPMMMEMGMEMDNSIGPIVIILVSVAVYGCFIFLFLFRSGYVLRVLRLEDDFDEDAIELDVQPVTLLTFVVILVGGIMVVNGLPALLKELISYISTAKFYGAERNIGWTIYYLAQCMLGLLLIFKNKPIVGFIEQRANDHSGSESENEILDAD